MLAELVVAAAVVVMLIGTVFSLVDPARGALGVQPARAEMQQRLRAGSVRLQTDLLLAGSGPHAGFGASLAQVRASVIPALVGHRHPASAGTVFTADAVTLMYAPPGAPAAALASSYGRLPAEVALAPAGDRCRSGINTCGFVANGLALTFDAAGRSDIVRVSRVSAGSLRLIAVGDEPALPFAAGAAIMPLVVRSYYHDRDAAELRHQNGWVTDAPALDGVVGFSVRYFGRPAHSADARIGTVIAPCLAAALAAEPFPDAGPVQGQVELTADVLTDGPWCGERLLHDVDLFRVRRVRVELRLQATAARHRGRDPRLFARPGPARHNLAPDLRGVIEVAPRTAAGF